MAYQQASQHEIPTNMGPTPSPYPPSYGYPQFTGYEGAEGYDNQQKSSDVYRHSQVVTVPASSRPLPNFRPMTLRWPFLCVIIAVIMGYMAMTEYALQRLPPETGRGEIRPYSDVDPERRKSIEAGGITSTIGLSTGALVSSSYSTHDSEDRCWVGVLWTNLRNVVLVRHTNTRSHRAGCTATKASG